MMNCCELPGYIPSFPQTWRNELSALLCEIINAKQNIDCQTVKDCETVTSFNSFVLNGNILTMSYTDERGVITARQQDLSSVNANPYIFNNGLTKNTNLVQLGGDLVKNTEIDLLGFNFILDGENIIFSDYLSTRTPDTYNGTYLFTNTSGKLMLGDFEEDVISVTENLYESPLTFNNGLTRISNNIVRLGGDLLTPTIIGGTNQLINTVWIKNNTSIGTESTRQDSSLVTGRTKITTSKFNFSTYHALNNFSSNTSLDEISAAAYLSNNLYLNSGPTTYTIGNGTYETSLYAIINVLNGDNKNISGKISAITTGGVFNHDIIEEGGGIISDFIGIRITAPTQLQPTIDYASKDFTGTITDTYGVFIEPQRGKLRNTAIQQNTWGIYQKSNLDNNHFSGNTSFGPEDRNTNSSILTVKYGNYLDDQFPLVAVKALLSAGTGSGLGDSFSSIISKLDIYASQLPALGFVSPTSIPFVYNPISSFESSVNYFSQSADVNVNIIGFKSALTLSSGTVEPDQTRPVINGGDIESVIGFLATRPLQILDNSLAIAGKYNGTINNTFGIYIEQQKSPDETGNPLTGFTQNNTWGVYQAGATDKNYFAGSMRLNVLSIPTFNNDTDAGNGGLVAGDIYKKSSGELMVKL